jgi:hypothetical protein
MATKRHLFHTLNQRARRQKQEQEEREYEQLLARVTDPRRDQDGDNLTRIYPLIDEES